jgi:hypothetical protein
MLRSIATQLYEGLRFIRIANQHKYCIYRYLISRQRLVMGLFSMYFRDRLTA